MRLQDNENKRKQHVIDINFFDRKDDNGNDIGPIDYILNIKNKIKQLLESPESRILYSELYDEEFGLTTNAPEDTLIGPVLYREQESIDDFNSYKYLIKLYLNREIHKFFGYTLTDFLNLSRYARMVLVDEAEEHMKVISERLTALQEDANGVGSDMNDYTNELLGEA